MLHSWNLHLIIYFNQSKTGVIFCNTPDTGHFTSFSLIFSMTLRLWGYEVGNTVYSNMFVFFFSPLTPSKYWNSIQTSPLESSVDAKIVLSRFIKRLSFLQAILDSWDQCSRDNTHCNHLKMARNFPGVCTSAVRCVQKQLKPDFAHPWICISTSTWRCNLLQLKRTGIMLTYALLSIQEKTR